MRAQERKKSWGECTTFFWELLSELKHTWCWFFNEGFPCLFLNEHIMSSSNIKSFPLWCLNWVLCILNKNKDLNYIFCSFHVLEPQKFRLLFCMMSAQSWTWSTKSIRVLTTSLGPSSGISWNRNKLVAFLRGYGCNRINSQFVVSLSRTSE